MPRKFSSFQNTWASNLQEQASANAYSATQQTTKQSSKEADGLQQQLLASVRVTRMSGGDGHV